MNEYLCDSRGPLSEHKTARGRVLLEKTGLLLLIAALSLGLAFGATRSAQAAQKINGEAQQVQPASKYKTADEINRKGPDRTLISDPADYSECVRVALTQSPLLVKSSLEIEAKRLDEHDAWATLIPPLSLTVLYYFSQPPLSDSSAEKKRKDYQIYFSSGAFNPFLSAFDIAAKRGIIDIAVTSHLKTITEQLRSMGRTFLKLAEQEKMLKLVKVKEEQVKGNLDYVKNKLKLGQATQTDLSIAEAQLATAKAETDKVIAMQSSLMTDLKTVLGVPYAQKINLDLTRAKEELLADYDSTQANENDALAHSHALKIMYQEKDLQRFNIYLSYVKFMPSISLYMQTPDPTTQSLLKKSWSPFTVYPGLQLTFPMEYLTKARDVSRQYKVLEQKLAMIKAAEYTTLGYFHTALSNYNIANIDVRSMKGKLDQFVLEEQLAEYRYKNGLIDYDMLLAKRQAKISGEMALLDSEVLRDAALLDLRYICGGLEKQYVRAQVVDNKPGDQNAKKSENKKDE